MEKEETSAVDLLEALDILERVYSGCDPGEWVRRSAHDISGVVLKLLSKFGRFSLQSSEGSREVYGFFPESHREVLRSGRDSHRVTLDTSPVENKKGSSSWSEHLVTYVQERPHRPIIAQNAFPVAVEEIHRLQDLLQASEDTVASLTAERRELAKRLLWHEVWPWYQASLLPEITPEVRGRVPFVLWDSCHTVGRSVENHIGKSLRGLAEKAGGWYIWPDGCYEFVPMSEWLEKFSAWEGQL